MEPNPGLRLILQENLQKQYQVRSAASAKEVFSLLFRGKLPQLMILDQLDDDPEYRLLLQELHTNRFLKTIPVVLLVDEGKQHWRIGEPEGLQVRLSLQKPFDPKIMRDSIDKILLRSEQSGASA